MLFKKHLLPDRGEEEATFNSGQSDYPNFLDVEFCLLELGQTVLPGPVMVRTECVYALLTGNLFIGKKNQKHRMEWR